MPPIHTLKDSQLKGQTPVVLHDGGGLYFRRVNEYSAHFFFRTQRGGVRPRKTGLGPYPEVTLAEARKIAAECRRAAVRGLSPKEVVDRVLGRTQVKMTFEEAARATYESKKPALRGKDQSGEWIRVLEMHAFPQLGKMQCRQITVQDVQRVLRPLWQKQYPTAKKVRSRITAALKYANATDNAVDIRLAERAATQLGAHGHKVKHHAALGWQDAPKLFASIGQDDPRDLALRFYLLTLPRIAPVRFMTWGELRDDAWEIPPDRMKGGELFVVPLSAAAQMQIELARYLAEDTGADALVFPSKSSFKRGVISENYFNNWLTKRDFPSTGHGLRATFRTWAAEEEICSREVAELALDHKIKGQVEKAYWRGNLFKQRLQVMEAWGAYLSGGLTADSKFIWRKDADGNDWSVSLNDIKAVREHADLRSKKERNEAWSKDGDAVAKWYRDDT